MSEVSEPRASPLDRAAFSCTRCRSRRRHPTSSNCASSIPSHLPLALMERRIALPSPAEHPEPPASVCRNAFFPHKNHHPTRLRSTPVCRRLAHHRSSLAPQSLRARQPQTAYWLRQLSPVVAPTGTGSRDSPRRRCPRRGRSWSRRPRAARHIMAGPVSASAKRTKVAVAHPLGCALTRRPRRSRPPPR